MRFLIAVLLAGGLVLHGLLLYATPYRSEPVWETTGFVSCGDLTQTTKERQGTAGAAYRVEIAITGETVFDATYAADRTPLTVRFLLQEEWLTMPHPSAFDLAVVLNIVLDEHDNLSLEEISDCLSKSRSI